MNVDEAYERFQSLRGALPPDDDRPITDNEACTRVHLIDPFLKDVLGWPVDKMAVEVPGGDASGGAEKERSREGRVDYVVRDHDRACWFVIEAKKRSERIVAAVGSGRGMERLKLTGPVLKESCWPIVSRQMAPYLGRYMPCFGAVTTGEQWVGFLGKLRPDHVLLDSMYAVVFRSLDDIEHDFELFFELFGMEGARRRALLRELHPSAARGLVHARDARRIVPPGAERPVDYQGTQQFYDDLRQAMEAAFRPIRTDRGALAACFVESRESRDASSRLERVANELGEALGCAVEDYPPAVCDEVDAASVPLGGQGGEVQPGDGYLARLLGEKSAGKTVFLRRFFDFELGARRRRLALLWLDVEQVAPFDPTEASRQVLDQLIRELFGDDGLAWEHVREVYRREWQQMLRLAGLTEADACPELRQDFLRERRTAEARTPQEALRRYGEFAGRNRKRLVCLVIDNVDHLEHPEAVLSWAVAIHRSLFAMTTVAMEDTTLWRLRRRGNDHLGEHQPEQFWLRRPMVREVVQNRTDYLKKMLESVPGDASRTRTTVGRRGQWKWSVSPEQLVRVVSAVLLDDEETAQWIGQLCNYDMREVLEVCQQIVLSPLIRADKLLSMQVVQKVSRYRVLRALIAPKSEQYQALPTDRVMNVFGYWAEQDFAPLLPARVLALLRAREDHDRNRREPFPGFIAVYELIQMFESCTSVPRAVVFRALRDLAALRVVEPFNPADQGLEDSSARVKITARGRLHLDWATREPTYVRLMAEVDPIVSDSAYRDLRSRWQHFLASLPRNDRNESMRLEREVASGYVAYLLAQANAVCPLIGGDDARPILDFERDLRGAWLA